MSDLSTRKSCGDFVELLRNHKDFLLASSIDPEGNGIRPVVSYSIERDNDGKEWVVLWPTDELIEDNLQDPTD